MATIANMTMEELKQLILDLLAEQRFSNLGREETSFIMEDEPDHRTLEEVFASVERNRWTAPSGSPTPAEMIREN